MYARLWSVMHSLTMGENSSRLLFLFETEPLMEMRDLKRLQEHFNRVFYLHDGSDAHIRIRETLLKAQAIYDRGDVMWNTDCYSCFLRIYALLGQRYLNGIRPRPAEGSRNVDSEVITAAMTYINNHYREDLCLEDVAGFAGFSRYYFSRSFKKQTGYSFKDYLYQA